MQNDMRDRLIKLLSVTVDVCNLTDNEVEIVADYLIANGVIIPPCKVGNTVYWIENNEIRVGEVTEIERRKEPEAVLQNAPIKETYNVCSALTLNGWELTPYSYSDFGKTVFLTKDQAEQKLKEMRGENDL